MLTTTTNGAVAYSTTLNYNLDLFSQIGAARKYDSEKLFSLFENAWNENSDLCLRIMLYTRDIREGLGERKVFRTFLQWLENKDENRLKQIIPLVAQFGRFDDLFFIKNSLAMEYFASQISVNGLAAKWAPRKGANANRLRKTLNMTPKQYRKFLVANTNVVETKMCDNDWENIDYSHVPPLAFTRYTKAFRRHTEEKFTEFLESVEKGENKINASTAVYPHNIVAALKSGDATALDLQWKSLEDFVPDNKIISVVDVSGSMTTNIGKSNIRCIHVAISLGLYTAERNKSCFKDMFITFSESPEIVAVKGKTLNEKVNNMSRAKWGYNTNIASVFELILDFAKINNAIQEDLPETILIISDMQFDDAVKYSGNKTTFEIFKKHYEDAGYKLPNVVFWNVEASGNMPIKFDDSGAALVSGFSTNICKNIMSGDIDPIKIMLNAVMKDRYKI